MRTPILAAALAISIAIGADDRPAASPSGGGVASRSEATVGAAPTATARAAPGVEAPRDRVPTDIRRLTILVRDMDRSLALYQGVLGLKVNYDAKISVSGVALPAGVPGNKTRLVLLNGNDPFIGWIGLMEYTDPPLPGEDQPFPRRLGPGGHVLVTNTDDAVKRCAQAERVPGVVFTAQPRLQVYEGRNGAPPIRVVGCNFFDPDGTFLELNQILKPDEPDPTAARR